MGQKNWGFWGSTEQKYDHFEAVTSAFWSNLDHKHSKPLLQRSRRSRNIVTIEHFSHRTINLNRCCICHRSCQKVCVTKFRYIEFWFVKIREMCYQSVVGATCRLPRTVSHAAALCCSVFHMILANTHHAYSPGWEAKQGLTYFQGQWGLCRQREDMQKEVSATDPWLSFILSGRELWCVRISDLLVASQIKYFWIQILCRHYQPNYVHSRTKACPISLHLIKHCPVPAVATLSLQTSQCHLPT